MPPSLFKKSADGEAAMVKISTQCTVYKRLLLTLIGTCR